MSAVFNLPRLYEDKENLKVESSIPKNKKISDSDMNIIKELLENSVYLDRSQDDEQLINYSMETLNPIIERYEELKPRTVWTNPNPNQNFAPQTISLGTTDYDVIEILYYDWLGGTGYNVKSVKARKGDRIQMETILFAGIARYYSVRIAIPNSSGDSLSVENVTSGHVDYTGTETLNNHCIPVEIRVYGGESENDNPSLAERVDELEQNLKRNYVKNTDLDEKLNRYVTTTHFNEVIGNIDGVLDSINGEIV